MMHCNTRPSATSRHNCAGRGITAASSQVGRVIQSAHEHLHWCAPARATATATTANSDAAATSPLPAIKGDRQAYHITSALADSVSNPSKQMDGLRHHLLEEEEEEVARPKTQQSQTTETRTHRGATATTRRQKTVPVPIKHNTSLLTVSESSQQRLITCSHARRASYTTFHHSCREMK